jgi:hypothetical protein
MAEKTESRFEPRPEPRGEPRGEPRPEAPPPRAAAPAPPQPPAPALSLPPGMAVVPVALPPQAPPVEPIRAESSDDPNAPEGKFVVGGRWVDAEGRPARAPKDAAGR